MSTGLACSFIEIQPGCWYYILQNWAAPAHARDWRKHATAYGPFDSFDTADQHLEDNHANPGGATVSRYEPGYEPDEVLAGLIARAQR